MINRKQINIFVILTVLIWWIINFISGNKVDYSILKPFTMVSGVLIVLYNLFDLYLWKWNKINPLLIKKPNIAGTWKIALISNWINPETNKRNPPSIIYLSIKQNYSKINVRIYTQNSESEQYLSQLIRTYDSRFKLISVYQNIPQRLFRDKSPIHFAAFIKNINGDKIKTLKGNYWTDRGTAGESYTVGHSSRYFYSYKEAEENSEVFSERNTLDSISIEE